jgi:hypothetical protein
MADDVNPALRAEIDAALAVIGPQIDGLRDLSRIEASEGFIIAVTEQYNEHVHRESLMTDVIQALDAVNAAMEALEADGYPATHTVDADAALLAEKDKQQAEIAAAFSLFVSPAPATTLTVTLGTPRAKT